MPKREQTHLSPTSVIKAPAPDVSQGLPSLSPGQLLPSWGRLVHRAVFPPPFSLGFSRILKPAGVMLRHPRDQRGLYLTLSAHRWMDASACPRLVSAEPWGADTQHSQPRLPCGRLPAHTPCALGQELFRKRAGGWLVWLGGDPENSEQAGSQLLPGKACTNCGPSVFLSGPQEEGFPGDPVAKNLPAGAGDAGSNPAPGRSCMPRGSWARVL